MKSVRGRGLEGGWPVYRMVYPMGSGLMTIIDYHTTVLKMLDAGSKLSGLGNETLP